MWSLSKCYFISPHNLSLYHEPLSLHVELGSSQSIKPGIGIIFFKKGTSGTYNDGHIEIMYTAAE
jgi:hypothetical protein